MMFLRMDSRRELANEVARARKKFPSASYLFTALVEEVGELADEMIGRGGTERRKEEALQTACVAMRLYEEGDPTYDGDSLQHHLTRATGTLGRIAKALLEREPRGTVSALCAQLRNDAVRIELYDIDQTYGEKEEEIE